MMYVRSAAFMIINDDDPRPPLWCANFVGATNALLLVEDETNASAVDDATTRSDTRKAMIDLIMMMVLILYDDLVFVLIFVFDDDCGGCRTE